MQGPHNHDWKYNEAVEVYSYGQMPYWKVFRFCVSCLEGEEVNLSLTAEEAKK